MWQAGWWLREPSRPSSPSFGNPPMNRSPWLGQVRLRRTFLGVTAPDEAHSLILSLDQYMGFKDDLGDVLFKYPWVNDPKYLYYDGVKADMKKINDLTPAVVEIRKKWSDPAITSLDEKDKKTVNDWEIAVGDLRGIMQHGNVDKNSVPIPAMPASWPGSVPKGTPAAPEPSKGSITPLIVGGGIAAAGAAAILLSLGGRSPWLGQVPLRSSNR